MTLAPHLLRAPNQPAASSVADRRVLAVITVILVCITFLQRFAVPLGSVALSVSVVVTAALLGYLVYHGDAVENPGATRAFLLAGAICCLVAGLVLLRDGSGSMTSMLYLLVTWSVFCVRLHPARHHLYPQVLNRFEKLMVFFAVLGILQTAAQAVGAWTYTDYLLQLVDKSFMFTGYNTSYPIQYGSPIIKANGFVFVEPSIFAQFLALALLSALVRRANALRSIVLGIALILTISGTGMLLVGFGIVVLAIRRGGAWTFRIALGLVLAGAAALATPFGTIILSRTGEASETNSSGSLRFVQPYERILDAWNADPVAVLIGTGPGRADALADQIFQATSLPINFAGLAKLVFEYGVPAAVAFCVFVAFAVTRRAPAPTLALAGIFGNAVLTGSLLQPQSLYLLLPIASLFIGFGYETVQDERRRTSRHLTGHRHPGRRLSDQPVGGGPEGLRVTLAPADPNGRGELR